MLFKKGGSVLREGIKVRYAMIKTQSSQFSLRLMCRLLSVSVSGYYGWRCRKLSRREEDNRQLAIKIKAILMMRSHELGRFELPND